MSEEDEGSSEEEERSETEEEDEVPSDEEEEAAKIPEKKGKEAGKEQDKKRQSAQLPTKTGINGNGPTARAVKKPVTLKKALKRMVLNPVKESERIGKKKKREAAEEEEEEDDAMETEEETETVKGGKPNKPTYSFGKNLVRDFSQPVKKYPRHKYLLGKFSRLIAK